MKIKHIPMKEKKAKSKKQELRKEDKITDTEEKDFGGLPTRDLKKNLGCGG